MGLNNKTSNTFRVLENNKQYSIFVTIYVSEGNTDEDLNISLNLADLDEVVYENKFNDLLMHGHVIFTDKYGDMDKFMSKQYVYLDLMLSYDEEKEDKTHQTAPMTKENTLLARFIVQNIKVLSRVGYTVKYKLDIISKNWFNCAAQLNFTNYGKDPETVFDIFKACLVQQGLKINQKMFDKVKTEVKLNYITQQNSNLFDVARYLFHKLYYFKKKEESMKFFTYNEFDDKYSLFDVKDKDTINGLHTVCVSFFKSNAEGLSNGDVDMNSFSRGLPRTRLYNNFFEYNMYDYDYERSCFTNQKISEDDLLLYANNKLDHCDYINKYKKRFYNGLEYSNAGAFWNNNQNIYDDMFQVLNETDSFIVDVAGDLHRYPGSYLNIVIDRNMKAAGSNSKEELERMKKKYRSFEGMFLVTKIIHTIRPTAEKKRFKQQFVACRNFLPK